MWSKTNSMGFNLNFITENNGNREKTMTKINIQENVCSLLASQQSSMETNWKTMLFEVFQTASIEVNKQSFHAIHQLKNKKVVIVKLVNWQDALSILRGKKKLWNLDEGNKNRLRTKKNYVNESLCPLYENLLAKCNALLKRKYIWNFYSVHGKLKI